METIQKTSQTVSEVDSPITYSQAVQLISESLAALQIYVVESDITEAQQTVRAIIDKSTF